MTDFVSTNDWVVGDATEKRVPDQILANTIATKEAGAERHLGGDASLYIESTSFVDLPHGVDVEIKGDNLGGHTVEVHVMAKVTGGTGQFELRNVTDGSTIAGSTTNVTGTSFALVKSGAITLTTGTKAYRLRVKAAATFRIFAYGAKVVIR